MGRLHWYKRDPRAAYAGMMELTLEERGAYNTIIDLIYIHDGSINDDLHLVASWLGVSPRIWVRIRNRLLERKKLYTYCGQLRNERADEEVPKALLRVSQMEKAGLASVISKGFTPRKTKHLTATDVEHMLQRTRSSKKVRSSSSINLEAEEPKETPSAAPATALLNGAPAPIAEILQKEVGEGSKKITASPRLEAIVRQKFETGRWRP